MLGGRNESEKGIAYVAQVLCIGLKNVERGCRKYIILYRGVREDAGVLERI